MPTLLSSRQLRAMTHRHLIAAIAQHHAISPGSIMETVFMDKVDVVTTRTTSLRDAEPSKCAESRASDAISFGFT